MRIDTHVHVTPPEWIDDWRKVAEHEPYFKCLSESPVNKFATVPDVVARLDQDGFDKAVVFGFSFADMGRCRYVNDYVIDEAARYPDRIIGFASVVPNHPEAEKELIRCKEAGLFGVGELFPAGQPFDIADRRDTARFARVCDELNFPVIIHINEPVGHHYAGKTDTALKEVEAFIESAPEVTVILAHWGGGLFFYELMKEMREKLKHVYYDNAASIFLYGPQVYEVARTVGVLDKVLFGSDFPLLPPARYMPELDKTSLTDEEREGLLGEHARRLFESLGII